MSDDFELCALNVREKGKEKSGSVREEMFKDKRSKK